MFDFETFDVYIAAKQLHRDVVNLLHVNRMIDSVLKQQWKRASLSVVLNIAEGTGRFTDADKGHFYTMARSSVFESTACLDIARDDEHIYPDQYQSFYNRYESISKVLFRNIKGLPNSIAAQVIEDTTKNRGSEL